MPETATWAGGPDGGDFIECRDTGDPALIRCTVYHDRTGDVLDDGLYLNETGIRTADLPRRYSSFSSAVIVLTAPEGADRAPTLVGADSTGRPLTESEVDDRLMRFVEARSQR